jgi:hypothetical protein
MARQRSTRRLCRLVFGERLAVASGAFENVAFGRGAKRTISSLRSCARSLANRVTNGPCRFASFITERSTMSARKRRGGKSMGSMRRARRNGCGIKR